MAEPHSSRRSLRRGISRRRFVVITKNGVRFARQCYCSSVNMPGSETELYGFVLKLLSFGGVMPLDIVRRWRRLEILRRASGRKLAIVTRDFDALPKEVVEEAMRKIWGRHPKSIYV